MGISTVEKFNRRKARVRSKLRKISMHKLRLSVFRSEQHFYAQIIDDMKGITLVSASTVDKDIRSLVKGSQLVSAAEVVGDKLAERALAKKITTVAFDRSGYKYHGRVAAFATAFRKHGIKV